MVRNSGIYTAYTASPYNAEFSPLIKYRCRCVVVRFPYDVAFVGRWLVVQRPSRPVSSYMDTRTLGIELIDQWSIMISKKSLVFEI